MPQNARLTAPIAVDLVRRLRNYKAQTAAEYGLDEWSCDFHLAETKNVVMESERQVQQFTTANLSETVRFATDIAAKRTLQMCLSKSNWLLHAVAIAQRGKLHSAAKW
jgi:hypothetical protein